MGGDGPAEDGNEEEGSMIGSRRRIFRRHSTHTTYLVSSRFYILIYES